VLYTYNRILLSLKMIEIEGRVVAHAYNPNYSEGRARGDHGLRTAQPKSQQYPVLINKPGMVVHTPVIPATQEA
jgi:hypothetical protein